MTDNTSKYPANIQKLFAPKLPLVYKKPLDYIEDDRKTHYITPISSIKSQWSEYVKQEAEKAANNPASASATPSIHQINKKKRQEKQQKQKESFDRQLRDWNDPELLAQNEKEFMMKDPYRTIFVSRLPYAATEIDISKSFNKYGAIESIRIIRDKVSGKSRGYGFIVFERELDAKNCIRELAPVGIKMTTSEEDGSSSTTRVVLVDIERGRLSRSWKPRRLGGGLGGRHYTKPNALQNNNASAAASGRRLHLSNNPYNNGGGIGNDSGASSGARGGARGGVIDSRSYQKKPQSSYYGGGGSSQAYNSTSSTSNSTDSAPPVAVASYGYTSRSSDARSADSVRDKYVSRSERSVRSLRNN